MSSAFPRRTWRTNRCRASAPACQFLGVLCRRARINRPGQFDMANRPRVERVQLALDYPEHRATSHEAIHLSVAVHQNNPAANSTPPLVPGESNVSELPKKIRGWH